MPENKTGTEDMDGNEEYLVRKEEWNTVWM